MKTTLRFFKTFERQFAKELLKSFLILLFCIAFSFHTKAQCITEVWGGARHCIALQSNGTVWCWGGAGSLGDNSGMEQDSPVEVHGYNNIGFLDSITHIMGGELYNFALKSDGTVWSWGNGLTSSGGNANCLGAGSVTVSPTPIKVIGVDSVIALGGRGYHALALRVDSTVWGWGSNMGAPAGGGQLGMDTSVSHGTSVAIKINGLSHIKQITGGGFYTMALLSNNTLVSLGNNYYGQLGVGDTASRHIPAPVVGLTNVKQVSGGWKHVVALRSDSTVWTWGSNLFGQLGTGNTTNSSVPVQVPGLSGFIQVSGGDHHTTALKADGTVWAWGENIRGECGDGTKIQRFSPVQVAGLSGIIYITARDYQNVAIKSDGTLWSWGWDINGQCGIGSTLDTIRVAQKVSVPGCNTANIETLSALRESSVFPNPFSFETTIKISGREKIENAEMNIFDVYGREIRKISGINTSEIKIEKESLSPALYFYEVRNEKSILLGKGKMMIQ